LSKSPSVVPVVGLRRVGLVVLERLLFLVSFLRLIDSEMIRVFYRRR
jgi:hypothetical protein